MKMAAGIIVTPSDFNKTKPLIESVDIGVINKFYIVTKPKSHKDTISDLMFEVTSLNHLSHWIRELYKHDHNNAHDIINDAKMFFDMPSAKHQATILLSGKISNFHDNISKSDKEDKEPELEEVKEELELDESSMDYDNNSNSLTWAPDDKPVNLVNSSDVDSFYKEPKQKVEEPSKKISVPTKIKTELKAVISELEKNFQHAAVHDINATGFYPTAIEVMNGLLDRLNAGTIDDIKMAQIEITKLSGAFLNKIPDSVILFISQGGATRSLKDIFSAVKIQK